MRLAFMAKRAAGLLVFRRLHGSFEYLMMQASYGSNHWTPPKGHVDPGESDLETALRETKEEAGLEPRHLNVYDEFQKILKYPVNGKEKTVVYWLAELKDPGTPVQMSDEHQAYRWLPEKDAADIGTYPEMRGLIQEAEQYLQSRFTEVKRAVQSQQ